MLINNPLESMKKKGKVMYRMELGKVEKHQLPAGNCTEV